VEEKQMNRWFNLSILLLVILFALACNILDTAPSRTDHTEQFAMPIETNTPMTLPVEVQTDEEGSIEDPLVIIATSTPTALIMSTSTVTETPVPPNTPTTTFTPTATEVPHVIALQEMNVRRGPGVVYVPPVTTLAAGSRANVIGRNQSADGRVWWRIECPPGVTVAQCWIADGPPFTQAVNTDGVPVVSAPSTPTPIPTPTPTITPSFTPSPSPTHAPTITPTRTNTPLPPQFGSSFQVAQLPTSTPLPGIPFLGLSIQHFQMVPGPVTSTMCNNPNPNPSHIVLNSDNIFMFWIEDGNPIDTIRIEVYRDGVLQATTGEINSVGRNICRAARLFRVATGSYETRLIYRNVELIRTWSVP
jgi:hypothetical protein